MTTIDSWLAYASADADRRGLPELKPLLAGLAHSTGILRAADWNESATGDGRGPSGPVDARDHRAVEGTRR